MSAFASQLFWLSTLVPGFALLLRLDRRQRRYGLLPAVALSFTLTLALVAPLAALAFAARASIQAVGFAWMALVAAGFVFSVRRGGAWLRAAWRATPRLPFFLLLAGLAAVAPLGGVVSGDSPVHVAKLRWLLDTGFTLQDPYSPDAVIESRYHVDAYHLLFAVGAWFGRRDPLEWWFDSAWFMRLVALGGIELLACAILRSRRAAAIAAVGGFFAIATTRTITYPNKFAAYALLPVLVAWTLEWLRTPKGNRPWRTLLPIAAGSLALAVVHVGFWAVVALLLLPAAAILRWRRDRTLSLGRVLALAGSYALPGIPFALFTALQANHADEQQGALTSFLMRTYHVGSLEFTALDLELPGAMSSGGIAILALLLLRRGRKESDRFAALFWLAAAACMWFPPLFALLTRVMPHWIVMRCAYALFPFSFALLFGVPAWWLSRRFRQKNVQFVLIALVGAAASMFHAQHVRRMWWTRDEHLEVEGAASRLRTLLEDCPEPRPLVVADPFTSTFLPAARHCSVAAPNLIHANPADPGLLERARLENELLARGTSPARRNELLRQLAVDYVLLASEDAMREVADSKGAVVPLADATEFEPYCERVGAVGGYVLLRPKS